MRTTFLAYALMLLCGVCWFVVVSLQAVSR
jgi:hypothetical protein